MNKRKYLRLGLAFGTGFAGIKEITAAQHKAQRARIAKQVRIRLERRAKILQDFLESHETHLIGEIAFKLNLNE